MTSQQIKASLLDYFRFDRQFPVVAVEAECAGWNRVADVVCIDKKGRYYEVEVKVSLSDLKADKGKLSKHDALRRAFDSKDGNLDGYLVPARFYFAVPDVLAYDAREIVSEHYPYAGIIVVARRWGVRKELVAFVYRNAPTIHDQILDHEEAWRLVRCQSATLVRAFEKLTKEAK